MHKFLLLVISIFLLSCVQKGKGEKSEEPKSEKTYTLFSLPQKLQEVSGITFITDSLVAAIEDEHGVLYYYDLAKEKIIKEYVFAEDGDYEDIVRVGEDIYIVKSNGTIYQINNFASEHPAVIHYTTPLKGKNDIEGLAYHPKRKSLLLSVKEKNLDKNDKDEETKNIYEFSLSSKELNEEPLYRIQLKDIENEFKGDKLLEASKKFLKAIGNENLNEVVKPSAMAYHPVTGNLYVLSAINKIIVVLNPTGKFLKIIKFSGSDFIQPEGLAFNSKAELFISNEGRNKKGNIIKLNDTDAK